MSYRVTVLVNNQLHQEQTAADWTEVRSILGNAVEAALTACEPHQREDAYVMDVPALQRALTRPETQEAVDTSGAWATRLGTAPVQFRVTREQ